MSSGTGGSGGTPGGTDPSTSTLWPSGNSRRLSYATVAAGGQGNALSPSRMNTLSAVSPGSTSRPAATRDSSRGSQGGMEIDEPGRGGFGSSSGGAGDWNRRAVETGNGRLGCTIHDDHPKFFTPSYLRHSRHVQRLQRQWEEHITELKENFSLENSLVPSAPSSLSTSPSHVSLGKTYGHRTHHGIVQDVVERLPPPSEEDKTHPLPSRWNEHDAQAGLEILAEGIEVRFTGMTKSSDEAASVRSNHPMPKECGLYYFEVTVLSRGKEGLIGIGFSGRKVHLNRLPGWEADSWAYHGDDGYSFACTPSGKPYGPPFSASDVIGCGVNFRTRTAFFTRNGVHLGVAFTDIKADEIYPSVGMKRQGEHLRVNFGREPFVFDIDEVMRTERASIMSDISKTDPTVLQPNFKHSLINNLISQYFEHEGYMDTAKVFHQEWRESLILPLGSTSQKPAEDPRAETEKEVHALNRQKIRKAILDGDIDRALKLTNSFYPHVLEEERNRDVYFRLRCRKFIEMMRRYTELQGATSASSSPILLAKSIDTLPSNGRGRVDPIMTQNIGTDHTHTQMELDDQLNRESSILATPPAAILPNDVDMDAAPKSSYMKQNELLTAALSYGQELQRTFGSDPRPQIKKQLEDVFAIMAYTDPAASVVGGLLDPKGRIQIAEDVNGAILVSLGRPAYAPLEKLCAQTEWLLDEAAAKRGGSPAFVNAQKDFMQP